MRNAQYAITHWVAWNGTALRPLWNQTVGVELYDHTADTGSTRGGGRRKYSSSHMVLIAWRGRDGAQRL